MSYNLNFLQGFTKSFKALAKRHKSLKADFKELSDSLRENPYQGVELSPGIRKIRMAITSKGKGKSGGARIITYTVAIAQDTGTVYFIDIYDKTDYDTVDVEIIKSIIGKITL